MNIDSFINDISSVSLDSVFNPYRDYCPIHDTKESPMLRRENLRSYLSYAHNTGIDTIWMGRDLGYRGGRRTGLALTDEANLSAFNRLYPGTQIEKSTKSPLVKERTAAEIWAFLPLLEKPPLLWNVFPFHPYEKNEPFTNRKFTSKELRFAEEINSLLFSGLGIKSIVAIGNDAEKYASKFGITIRKVRHPSYGGIKDFRSGLMELYDLI